MATTAEHAGAASGAHAIAAPPPVHEPNPVLELNNVSRSFAQGSVHAVRGVSLAVYPGEIVSILGPSGCGKTTTMRLIAGLDRPSGGEIRILGRSVIDQPPHRRNIGLVFQSLAIFPHMSVRQNVAFGLRMRRMARAAIEDKVARVLELVQLPAATYAERMPNALSGGQLQRVALARTIVTEPALVLFDEPMAALDRRLRDHMAAELRAIQKHLNIAAIYVTHDQETASAMSDRIAIMNAGEIAQVGTPAEIYERPTSRFVAEFLGDVNYLRAVRDGPPLGDGSMPVVLAGASLRTRAAPASTGREVTLMIRPEHVELHMRPAPGAAVKGRVVTSQFVAGAYRCRVRLDDGQELTARGMREPASVDDAVWLDLRPERLRIVGE